ncbi:chromosome segregation protein SMC [Weissella minor]|uniref:chromosome segregation protein SMC n=1 Tax=Weissella minor TaxID=1620 RepID=UPI001BAECE9D|nr:chromosome segregation protein SMC [Weissella minor]MBS0949967.1 chromosome segregation protein SMC [Weissella minor]
MKLKALSMHGFKSFSDSTQIDFMPGITGIVGPNGSGKSNIIEAIRWVMGEQSAKGLRGDKMADVIFGGTKTRAPLNRAEVGIVFDNRDHYLKSDFDEIEIKRILYRNGDSKYLLNGKQVRLRDIQELFMDSGLGHESFSIISQGRVEYIFSAKPEDRRSIIEDVAGVYKYKQNKTQAGKKLTNVQDNLDRVTDILYELEQRLEPLAKQSAKAKDYQQQKAAYDELDYQRLQNELTLWQQQLSGVLNQMQQAQSKADVQTDQLKQQQQQLEVARQTLAEQRETQQQQQRLLLEISTSVENLAGELKLQAERAHNQAQLVETTKATLDERRKSYTNLMQQIKHAQSEVTQTQVELSTLAEQMATLTREADHQQLKALEGNREALRNDVVDALEQLTTAKNNQRFAQQEDQRADAQANRYRQRQGELAQQLTQAQSDLERAQHVHQSAQSELTQAQTDLTQQQQVGQELEKAYQQQRQAWYDQLQKQQQVQARVQSLQRLNEQYDGYYQGVKNLMKQHTKFPGIKGVVAELIQVDAKYQLAIETALGAALQQVVVDEPATAKQAIQYLSQNHLGRVTFLPLATIKARHLQSDLLASAQATPGYLGTAAELVDLAPEFQLLKQHLLATTVIAENLEQATPMAARLKQRVRIVTLDGQVINAGGSMTGGASRNQQQGLLTQKNELADLSVQLETLNQEVAALEQQVQAKQAALQPLTENFKNQQDTVMHLSEVEQQKQADVQVAKQTVTQLEQAQTALTYDMQVAGVTTGATATQAQVDLKTAQSIYDDATQRLDDMQLELETLRTSLAESDERLLAKQMHQKTVEATFTHMQANVARLNEQASANEQAQQQLTQQLKDLQSNQQDVTARLEAEYANKQAQQQTVEQQVQALEQQIGSAQVELEQLERQMTTGQSQQQSQMQVLNQLTNQKSRLQTQIEQAEVQLSETYDAEFEPQAQVDEADLADLKKRLLLLKRGLDDIGTVNLDAIEEYEQVQERYDFLKKQKQDLLDAHADLTETMSEMDEEVKTRFKTTFDAVNEHFERIFVKMFGGGQAKLYLNQPDDLLRTGIDIKAQPPGKKFQQMSLLSGGEKALTAISLLFAILAVRPVPFVVLDETEAALDEANVDRFANYLQDANEQTQFIVITHRQGTMAACDVLYGVTMQEPGVSTMVSVNLNQSVNERGEA